MEADVYPIDAPDNANLIDGCIGELSPFHETFGYYAHGIGPETAMLPVGWKSRLVPIANENTGGVTGLCLSPVDLAISKLCAGREKDLDFVNGMLRSKLTTKIAIESVCTELTPDQMDLVAKRLLLCR
jgi:hypothetical protein